MFQAPLAEYEGKTEVQEMGLLEMMYQLRLKNLPLELFIQRMPTVVALKI